MLLASGQDRQIHERLAAELADVECRFAAELISDLTCVNNLVTHVERYRGKMLRPMLVLVSGMACAGVGEPRDAAAFNSPPFQGEAGGGSNAPLQSRPKHAPRPTLPQPLPQREGTLTDAHRVVAGVVEMVHMATLVHDDILDDAEVRRRGLTVNAMNGNEAAVMLGDYLISHAYHLCSSLDMPAISRIIADTTNVVCEGELLQLANRNNWQLDEGTYFEIIRRKTASLTGTCCRLGALLHAPAHQGGDDAVAQAMYSYGEQVGVAFQVVDDLLDLTGEEKTVGKSLGRDLAKGKLTLPMIHFLATSDASRRQRMVEQIAAIGGAAPSNGDGNGNHGGNAAMIEAIRQTVASSGSIDYARQWAGRLIDAAKASLDALPDSPARTLLMEMADMVLTRKA